MRGLLLLALSVVFTPLAFADPVYCPQRAGYINVGMTEDEVINACGQPISKVQSTQAATQKVPMQQLIYNALNTGSVYPGLNDAFYNQWSLPSGTTGTTLQISVVNNKVKSIELNGSSTNAFSLCHDTSIQVGDDVNAVYNACGSPNMTNSTYAIELMPGNPKSETWLYQSSKYLAPMSLTFVNGTLQSIQ